MELSKKNVIDISSRRSLSKVLLQSTKRFEMCYIFLSRQHFVISSILEKGFHVFPHLSHQSTVEFHCHEVPNGSEKVILFSIFFSHHKN